MYWDTHALRTNTASSMRPQIMDSPPPQSCDLCQNLFTQDQGRYSPWALLCSTFSGVKHTVQRGSLEASARKRCKLCQLLLLTVLEADRRKSAIERDESGNDRVIDGSEPDHEVHLQFQFQKRFDRNRKTVLPVLLVSRLDTVFSRTLEFDVRTSEGDALNEPQVIRLPHALSLGDNRLPFSIPLLKPTTDRGTPSTFSTVKRWVNTCDERHRTGHPKRGHGRCFSRNPSMPTRLIDVSSAPTHIRLVKVTPGDHTPYIALSYCWGESHPLVTGKQSLAQHMDDIPITKLPWTILDAVKVARWLGVQYIWVDALCIVQDCEHDKELEMARMQQVFQNAYLTIVAAQARNCREGFLKTDNHWNELAALPVRCENGAIGTMRLRARRARAADDGDDDDDGGHHGREPIHERGWTLQEVLLSPRLLVYGRTSVVWKCFCFDQGRTCNPSSSPSDWNGYCAAAGLTTIRLCPSGRIVQPAATVTMPHLRLFPDSAYAELLPRLYRVWEHVVQDYSNRRLTNPADKPAALAGVAGYFQRALRDDTYVAGLWKAQFMHELCWTVVAGESAVAADGVRPDVWRAPSWSWLSVDAAVAFEANAHTWFEPAARLLAAEAVPVVAAAPFSRLRRGAWLRLRGCLLSAWEACFCRVSWDAPVKGAGGRGDWRSGCWLVLIAECGRFLSEDLKGTDPVTGIWGLALAEARGGKGFERVGHFVGDGAAVAQFRRAGETDVVIF